MNQVPLNRIVLLNRLAEIERDVVELSKFQRMPTQEFTQGVHYAVKDLETFAQSLKQIIEHPEKIGLTIR